MAAFKSVLARSTRDTLRSSLWGWRLVGLIFVALLVAGLSYVFMCHPDLELLRSDPAAYKRVYGSTSPLGWRCVVLCGTSGLIVLLIGIGSGIAARALRYRRSGVRPPESG
jgi:hypothetical protein